MRKLDPLLQERFTTIIQAMGYELLGGEVQTQGRQTILRLYIDREQGVTIDDCALVSHQISAMMAVEEMMQAKYFLEVSSPGIDRPLFTLEQFRKQIGNLVKVRLVSPLDQRRQFKGLLLKVEAEDIYLLDEQKQEIKLPFSAIDKANVVGDVRLP